MPEVSGSGGGITISAEVYRCDIDNVQQEDLSDYFIGGEIDMNVDRDIKLAARLTLREPSRVTPYVDYLAPYIRLEYDDDTATVYRNSGTRLAPVWTVEVQSGYAATSSKVNALAALHLYGAGAPVDYTDGDPEATGEGTAPKGALYSDTTTGLVYRNSGTQAEPLWTRLGDHA
jgi:hypothetical protein